MMDKKLGWMAVVLVLLIAPVVNADPGTVYVDDDGLCGGNNPCYTSIQSAIDAAGPGDTVFVYAGTYYERLTVDKPLRLLAEDLDTTMVNGGDYEEPLYITSEGVTIEAVNATEIGAVTYDNTEFVDGSGVCGGNMPCHTSIQAAVNAADPRETVYVYAGIYLEHVTIDKEIALMGEDRETTIIDGGGNGDVVYVSADYVTIGGLTVRNGYNGISLVPNWSIHHFTFKDAIVTANSNIGIYAPHSNSLFAYHLLEDCVISDNGGMGLYAHQFSRSVIRNCEVFGNKHWALDPAWGYYSVITHNRVHDNVGAGIHLDSMYYTTVEQNAVWDNVSANGISLGFVAAYNTICGNVVHHNTIGLYTGTPNVRANRFHHNDLIDNTYNGWDSTSANWWDTGGLGGNYWSDYTGQDKPPMDGIGDTPYYFTGNQDNYPLMQSYNSRFPHAVAGGPYLASEGEIITLDASASYDDGVIESYRWDLDSDGEYDDAVGITTEVFFGDDGSFTVGLQVTDWHGLTDTDVAEITILNVAPAPSISGPAGADEGSPVALLGSATDPAGANDTIGYAWSVTKDGEPYAAGTGPHVGFTPDDNGSYIVTLTASDEDGGSASISHTVTVANVAPSLGVLVPDPANPLVAVDIPVSFHASFNDPGGAADEPYTCSLDWDGDGAVDQTIDTAYGACTASHAYANAGIYSIGLMVADKDGSVSNMSTFAFVVVYDPGGGFVTGGGWIQSPAGAYVPDRTLTGKAGFGFVSRYQKGADVPAGQTEFQFQVADLNFHSETYDWLIVNQNGSNAQFKGEGTINGQVAPGGSFYKFMIWATDGSPDTFRITIWYETLEEKVSVYDNGVDQPIDGGSIVIHTRK